VGLMNKKTRKICPHSGLLEATTLTPSPTAWDEVFLAVPRLKGAEAGPIKGTPREPPTTRWRRVSGSLPP